MSVAMSSMNAPPFSYPHQQPAGLPAGSQRLRVEPLSDTDRNFAMAMHLGPLIAAVMGAFAPIGLLIPLILWLMRKDHSVFNDDHGREAINVGLTALVFALIALPIILIGWLAYAVWLVVIIINQIRGAVAASRGEYFRYPMILRFLS